MIKQLNREVYLVFSENSGTIITLFSAVFLVLGITIVKTKNTKVTYIYAISNLKNGWTKLSSRKKK